MNNVPCFAIFRTRKIKICRHKRPSRKISRTHVDLWSRSWYLQNPTRAACRMRSANAVKGQEFWAKIGVPSPRYLIPFIMRDVFKGFALDVARLFSERNGRFKENCDIFTVQRAALINSFIGFVEGMLNRSRNSLWFH